MLQNEIWFAIHYNIKFSPFTGPNRDSELDKKVDQLKSMGFEEVSDIALYSFNL